MVGPRALLVHRPRVVRRPGGARHARRRREAAPHRVQAERSQRRRPRGPVGGPRRPGPRRPRPAPPPGGGGGGAPTESRPVGATPPPLPPPSLSPPLFSRGRP